MKPTQKNLECLKMMGFKPETDDLTGWWTLECGWAFVLDNQRSIKSLVKRLMKTEYERGLDDK